MLERGEDERHDEQGGEDAHHRIRDKADPGHDPGRDIPADRRGIAAARQRLTEEPEERGHGERPNNRAERDTAEDEDPERAGNDQSAEHTPDITEDAAQPESGEGSRGDAGECGTEAGGED